MIVVTAVKKHFVPPFSPKGMMQGDLAKRAYPPPDVIFAQKAAAIVKAAGMDPRNIDLERFRQNAPLVFSRAYSAIYKEKLLTMLTESSSKEDKILNSQLVLDGLFTKTRNPILLQLSGSDLYEGSHRAIGILVGILFAEGQRLWLEKIKSVEPQDEPSMQQEPISERERAQQLRAAAAVLDRNDDGDLLHGEDEDEEDGHDEEVHGYGGQEIRESLQTLHKMRSNPDIGPVEHQRLLSRIAFLEEQLLKRKPRKKHKKHTKSKPLVKRISEAILQDNEINERGRHRDGDGSDDDSGEGHIHTTRSTPRGSNGLDEDGRRVYTRGGHSRSPNRRGDGVGIAESGGRKTRPVSAPSTSHRRVNKVRSVSNRLYSAAPSRKDLTEETNNPSKGQSKSPGKRGATEPGNGTNHNKAEKEYYDPSLYTYDWKSGRRILLSQAQLEAEERKRAKEAMNNIMAISDNEMDALMGGGGGGTRRPGSPTAKPHYPSKSISGDVDKWLQRMRRDRHGEAKPPPKPEDAPMPEPRYFAAYQKLEDRDLIITIEHCYNCAHHNVTTRHKQDEYVNYSSAFLRVLAQIAHDCGVCARVGVSRFKANVTPTSATTDENSRIGAFEIQVAYKQPNGRVIPATLHSKLASRRWPSKSVLEKRFRAFMAQAKVSTSQGGDEEPSSSAAAGAVRMANDSRSAYPVGSCSWALSPVADPMWSFGAVEAQAAAAAPAAPTGSTGTATGATATSTPRARSKASSTAAAPTAAAATGITNVQWAFDMRELAEAPPKFAIGSTIRVKQLNFAPGSVERHALLCVVKEYVDPSDAHASDLVVKPLYQSMEVRVPQRHCVNLTSYTDRDADYSEDAVPAELEALILLAQQHKLVAWDLSKGDGRKDANGDICLSRKGFFNQVRRLSWAVEKKLVPKGQQLLTHPLTGVSVDVQHSYSEEVINWVFSAFKGEGNVTALERMVTAAAAASAPSSPSKRLERTGSMRGNRSPGKGSLQHSASGKSFVSEETLKESLRKDHSSAPSAASVGSGAVEARAVEAAEPPPERKAGQTVAQDVASAEETAPTPQAVEEPAPVVGDGAVDAPAQGAQEESQPAPAATGNDAGDGEASSEPTVPEKEKIPSESEPAPPAETPSTPATAAPAKASLPAKRFSRIDLVGAADKALKHKLISALALPGQPHDASLSAMERMAILYQLSDTVFEEAVVESDENAELSQAAFLGVLRSFGLEEIVSHPSALEVLLLKGRTSGNTPTVPVKVESFMNWLITGESRKHRQASFKAQPASDEQVAATAAPEPAEQEASPVQEAVREPEDEPGNVETQPAENQHATVRTEPSPRAVDEAPQTVRSEEPVSTAPASTAATPTPVKSDTTTPRRSSPSAQGSAKASTVSASAKESSVSETARTSPRGDLSSRPSSQRSLATPVGAVSGTARSAQSVTDDPETAERKQEELRKSLNYQPKEMEISTIVIEGDQLAHSSYDSVMVNVKIGTQEWNAVTCMAREKGSKRRTYHVKWPEVLVSEPQFRNDSATVTVAVSDPAVAEANPALPYLPTTALGEAPHSIRIPLFHFLAATFDVCREVRVAPVVAPKKGAPPPSEVVKLTIHGNSRDPKGVRTARIMSMRPQELLNIKFDPIPLDDAEDLYESDQESVESAPRTKASKGSSSGAIPEGDEQSPKNTQEEEAEELTRTLFPKASMANLNTAKPGAPLVNTLLE